MQDFLQPADIDTAVIHFLVEVVVMVLRFGIERKIYPFEKKWCSAKS